MVGEHKGFKGNVERVDTKKYKVYIEGLTVKKVDGSEVLIPIDPSNLMITKLNLDDKMRQKIFDRAKKQEMLEKKPEEVKNAS
jgi:large subunit ribosomal protein L24